MYQIYRRYMYLSNSVPWQHLYIYHSVWLHNKLLNLQAAAWSLFWKILVKILLAWRDKLYSRESIYTNLLSWWLKVFYFQIFSAGILRILVSLINVKCQKKTAKLNILGKIIYTKTWCWNLFLFLLFLTH